MQLLKPAWVADEGHALMSIDIHPDGTRFVTGGQGTDCGRVCIWNLRPVLDANVSKDKSVPKLLTQVKKIVHPIINVQLSSNSLFSDGSSSWMC